MGWTFSDIKAKVRKLTGKRSTNQLSDADLGEYVNNFYQWDLPVEVGSPEFDDWYEFNTEDGVGYQALPETILSVNPPVFIDNERASWYTNDEDFWDIYPWDQVSADDEEEPEAVLQMGRTLYLRPVPDDVYAVKIKCRTTKPTVLSDASDEPLYEGSGPMIAYGTAINIAMDDADSARADELAPMYQYYKGLVVKRDTQNIQTTTTSNRSF